MVERRHAIERETPVEIRHGQVVALNRAVALAERDGPAAALEPLATRLGRWHLFHAARGEMLRRMKRHAEARAATREALALVAIPPSDGSSRGARLSSAAAARTGRRSARRGE